MPEKDTANLLAMLDAIEKVLRYVEGLTSADQYYHNPLVFDATLMNFGDRGDGGPAVGRGEAAIPGR